ncbi:oxidoreductase [Sulfurifustis variabilis]|uniref:Oxidoreductase n=1 Tax=Sulfurifustis variabilis TaxID=1675686 RepID=A0A1B4V5S4_9GAMM|nr:Gfo/Idh/MocA family oxidoreductase [Sulfurifustis variabilis]BAU48868.1 oxidoreductase [Sulfurifustis variabilis]
MTDPQPAPAGRLRVGVIGVGYLGRFHARIYASMPDVELVGVADVDGARARSVAEQHGCLACTDPQELLERVEAVSIVVPTVYHAAVARPFLERGVHMLMEKPIAPTLGESEELVELAESKGVVFQVGHLERFNAGIMELARRVTNPRFLEVHRLGTFVERAIDVDVVTDLMIHDIDIVLSLVKSNIRSIAADGIPVITEHVDIANARIEFENGAVANVTASRVSNKKLRRIRIFGNEHYYGLDYIDQKLEVVRAVPDEAGGKWPKIVTEVLAIEPRPPLDTELAYFVDAVRHRSRPLVDGRVGLEALRVAMLVKEKIQS